MALALPSGSTVNFTWNTFNVVVAITPNGGSTTTISTTERGASRLLELLINDAVKVGSMTNTVSRRTSGAPSFNGNPHLDF